jgi:hypothetical protein
MIEEHVIEERLRKTFDAVTAPLGAELDPAHVETETTSARTRRTRRVVLVATGVVGALIVTGAGWSISRPATHHVEVSSVASTDTTSTTSLRPGCTYVVPLPNFDPRTATVEEIEAAGFPPRPSTPAIRNAWESYVEKYLSGQLVRCRNLSPSTTLPGERPFYHG